MARCQICGQVLIDDMEVGQGHCVTAPCWIYASGQVELAQEWEEDNPGFWAKADLSWLCEGCGTELDEYDKTCPHCDNDEWDWT